MRSAIQAQIYAQTACIWEATARKIGNVHARKHFETTEYTDFLISAGLLGIAFDQKNSVGRNVLNTIALTSANVRQNTNLGIALMIAPLFACNRVESTSQESTSPELTSEEVEKVLNLLNEQDAKDVYEAIRLAKPGGLGKVDEGDVSQQPTVNLLEAMSLAAERDQIAFEYTHCFHKTLHLWLPRFRHAWQHFRQVEPAIIELQLEMLAHEPDSLIARKNGQEKAAEICQRAKKIKLLDGIRTPEGRKAAVELDAYLRSAGNKLNPGTTADIIAAVLYAALYNRIVNVYDLFHWNVEDWL